MRRAGAASPTRRTRSSTTSSPRGAREYVAERRRVRHFPTLVRQTPELREAFLWRRVFLTRRSAAFDLALTGAALAALRRSPWPLAAALPYARLAWRGAAAEIAADAVGAARAGLGLARRADSFSREATAGTSV